MNNSNEITLTNNNGREFTYGQIPDLWYLAEAVLDGRDFGEFDENTLGLCHKNILEVWHMAHDLKAALEGQDKARIVRVTAEPQIIEAKRTIDLVMIRDTDGKIKFRSKRDIDPSALADHWKMRRTETLDGQS